MNNSVKTFTESQVLSDYYSKQIKLRLNRLHRRHSKKKMKTILYWNLTALTIYFILKLYYII